MQFGQKREGFEDPNQIALPLDIAQEVLQEQEEVVNQEITYSRANKKHPGRAKLPGAKGEMKTRFSLLSVRI